MKTSTSNKEPSNGLRFWRASNKNKMEQESSNRKNCNKANDSLGILNMDNLKVFGERSVSEKNVNNQRCTGDRLNMERFKAFETLKKFDISKQNKQPQMQAAGTANKENQRISAPFNQTPSDKSDFVPYRRPNTINISDLVTDESIILESSSLMCNQRPNKTDAEGRSLVSNQWPREKCNDSRSLIYNQRSNKANAGKDQPIAFEPAEITGRSTLNKHDRRNGQRYIAENVSVSDILVSSFAKKARDLNDTLHCGNDSTIGSMEEPAGVRRACNTTNSSLMSYGSLRSLPRTADMSKMSQSDLSLIGGDGFSFGSALIADQNSLDDEQFAPSEMMMNKLVLDEIAWADEFAAIPAATLSKQAKETAQTSGRMTSNRFDAQGISNSMHADPNFSVGTFFNMRSENIWDIVKSKSPDKFRKPIALIDTDDDTRPSFSSVCATSTRASTATTHAKGVVTSTDTEVTPKIDNKTYTKLATPITNDNPIRESNKPSEKHESKDSGHDSQNSFLLSMSAIDRALCHLNIETDNSEAGVIEQVLTKAKKSKSPQPPRASEQITRQSMCLSSIADILSENKENLDPDVLRNATLSDTMDFTESLLNSSEMKQLQRSNNSTLQRSPLSPLNVLHPHISAVAPAAGHEADIDEWPTTPIKGVNRRVRRTKSPRDVISPKPSSNESEVTSSEDKTPAQGAHKQHSRPKSLCSTRLDGAATECDLGISPTISHNASPNITITAPTGGTSNLRNNSLNMCQKSQSPTPFPMASPISSPRSGMSSPSVSGYRSPHLDSTTNSERRFLNAGVSVHKSNSSPVASEPGQSNYGVAPTRTYSATSQRYTSNNGRSISRCSNSSEFSHRDGKIIPLKVTTLELSWGSTKLRTSALKTMQVKNISNKRLVVRLEVHGPGFQLVNSQSNALTLQSQECRSIIITFCPTVTGVAIGALCFYSPLGTTTMNGPFLEIPLYAYGGHAAVLPQNMLKGPVGAPFLPMGDVCELTQPLQRTFRILNRGPLLGFAHVTIDSLGLMMPRLSDAFEVHPQSMLIPPGQSVSVNVIFRPRRDDVKKIAKKIQQVLTLANMRIICGDEANRQRMRLLLQRMTTEERSKIASSTLDKLWNKFPNEIEVANLDAFKEQPDVIMDLIACMRIQEIALTINRDGLDDTVQSTSMYYPDADDTVLFRTICASSPVPNHHLEPVDEVHEATQLEENARASADKMTAHDYDDERAVSSTRQEDTWSVHPSILEFDFRTKNQQSYGRVSLLIRNSCKSRQYFEVTCNRKNLLVLTPSEGYVAPEGGQVLIEVRPVNEIKLRQESAMEADLSLLVHMENERITIPVKVYS